MKISIIIPTIADKSRIGSFDLAFQKSLLASQEIVDEIVIADNSQSSKLDELIHEKKDERVVHLKPSKRLSMADNWNVAVESTKNNHFLILSDDDIIYPSALSPSLFEEIPEKGIYSFSCIYRNTSKPFGWKMPPKNNIIACIKECPKLCATVICKDAFHKAGRWDQKRFGFYLDWVTILKIVKQFGIYPINKTLGVYNTNDTNASILFTEEYKKYNRKTDDYFSHSTDFQNEYPYIRKKLSNHIQSISRDRNASTIPHKVRRISAIHRLRFL